MRRLAFILIPLCALSMASWRGFAQPVRSARQRVHFRLIDGSSGRPTMAMICIRHVETGKVHLPPDGRISRRVSLTSDFYEGVTFDSKSANWIGPVRKMSGKGDNNDRSFVYENEPSIPYWREPVMFQTLPEFFIELEPGAYRISVARGMEHIPVRMKFQVVAGGKLKHDIKLSRWIDLSSEGWHSGDVHVHHPTLKKEHREFLLSYAKAADLRVVNVLEMGHHKGTEFRQAGFGKEQRSSRDGYWLVSGQEEPRSHFGHIIGLNITSLVRDVSTYDYYDIAFQGIHAQAGALVGFAHFSWNGCALPRGFPWYVTTEEIDFVELLQFGKLNTEDYHDYLNLGFRMAAAAGSDIPWGSTLGEVRTYVYTGDKVLDIDAWFRALKQGRTFVSNGPAIFLEVNGKLPGTELRLEKGSKVSIRLRATGHPEVGLPQNLRLYAAGQIVKQVDNSRSAAEILIELDHEILESQWIAAGVTCKGGALAHTTPVYVVVDGRPTWNAGRGPAIIRKQLRAIDGIEDEFSSRRDEYGQGIRKRLKMAREYYAELERAMKASR